MKDYEIPEGDVISAMVADYMKDRQQRMEDGTFTETILTCLL